jgi:hypothetical protein
MSCMIAGYSPMNTVVCCICTTAAYQYVGFMMEPSCEFCNSIMSPVNNVLIIAIVILLHFDFMGSLWVYDNWH